MGYNGRDCVCVFLCESSRIFQGKMRRTMVQELIRTVFTLPKSKVLSFEHPELIIYDHAFKNVRNDINCADSYPKCGFSVIELMLGKYSKPSFLQGFM